MSELPASNLYELFRKKAEAEPARTAFSRKIQGQWKGLSFGEALGEVRKIASGLKALGIGPGDRVAIMSQTRLEWVLADLAIFARGGVVIPIYPSLTAEESKFIMQDSKASVVFADTKEQAESLAGLGENVVRLVICFEGASGDRIRSFNEISSGSAQEDIADEEGKQRATKELATVIYTSGTTARPKGVMLTHKNILSNVAATLEALALKEDDSTLSFLPLAHIFARTGGYYVLVAHGLPIYFAESVEAVPQNLQEVRPTIFVSVPRLYEKIYGRITSSASEGSAVKRSIAKFAFATAVELAECWEAGAGKSLGLRLRAWLADLLVFKKIRARLGGRLRLAVSGGAPLAPDIARFFFGVGLPIHEGYGLTETSPVICVNRPGRVRFGSVGPPVKDVEVRIAEDGEILCRGPGVMQGYLNLPEETSEVIKDGWLYTGDIGELDSDQFLRITDRKKAIIVLATGKNVVPQELETCLKKDPLIMQVVPWGDKKPYMTALVVPDPDLLARALDKTPPKNASEREALCREASAVEFVQQRMDGLSQDLAPYKRIKKIYLYPHELTQEGGELTPTLKVKKRVIAEKYGQKLEDLYAS